MTNQGEIILENKIAKSVIIDEQMRIIVNENISEYGLHYKISRGELYELLGARFQTKKGSIIPSDYCYDRTNKGIIFNKKPRLFAFLGKGMYECLGDNYPFTGPVFTHEKGAKNKCEVGYWENGLFKQNSNWELCGLK